MSQITLIRSKNPVTVNKVFYQNENGRQKRSVAHVTEAQAKHVDVSTAPLMIELLKRVTQSANEVLCAGVFKNADDLEFKIITEAKLAQRLGENVGELGVYELNGERFASRVKRGMEPCQWVLLDADTPKDMPPELAAMSLDERLRALEPIIKGISKCERIELRSSSSRVRQAGSEFGGASHAWIRVSDPHKIDLLKAHLRVETDALGLSYISKRHSSKDGLVVGSDTRTLIDLSTLDTGRLVFCAKPQSEIEGDEIGDAEITLVHEGCGELDISHLQIPKRERLRAAKQKTGIERQFNSMGAGSFCVVRGLLTLDTEFEVKGIKKPVHDWMPEAKRVGKLRGEAPFRDSQSEAAFMAVDDFGDPLIYDVGNNTTYLIAHEPMQLLSSTEGATDDAQASAPNDWHNELIKDHKGRVINDIHNYYTIIKGHEDWRDILAYDELRSCIMLTQPIPTSRENKSNFKPRELSERDITNARRWFAKFGLHRVPKNDCFDAMQVAAHENIISPIKHYLQDLIWDGQMRLDKILVDYAGADDSKLNRIFGAKFMIGAVARALDPGCKNDTALVMEGPQGVGKSTFGKILAGEDYFHDGLPDLHSKDASSGVRGMWFVELSELSAMRRSENEATKAFLSRTHERFRPAYARTEVIEPRRCVFFGTTNRSDYLTDDTGGRRFWPVRVTRIDREKLKRDRDQLWAEAISRYKKSEKWWLDVADEELAAKLVMERTADDPWEAKVLLIVDKRAEVCTREILNAMEIELPQQNKAVSMRVAGILTRANWVRDGKFSDAARRGLARYRNPDYLDLKT
jgi:predicted P-loop ATPase